MNLNQVKGIVGGIATKAKSSAKHVAKKIQQHTEAAEKLTRSMDAMDASGRALVRRSKKQQQKQLPKHLMKNLWIL